MNDPAAISNLALLSSFCPQPPRIRGRAHTSTRVAPCVHADIPTSFRYAEDSLERVQTYLVSVLLGAPGFPSAAVTQARARPTHQTPLSVQGESGLVSDILLRLIDPLISTDSVRAWQQRGPPYDLGLRGEDDDCWLAHGELKCGFNDAVPIDPAAGPPELDIIRDTTERIVLSRTFFDSLMSYLQVTGGVSYSEVTQDLIDFPTTDPDGLAALQDSSDEENIRRVLCQIRSQMCRTQLEQADKGNRYYILSTFRHAVLFTLQPDEITISPVLTIDGICTPQRPIGNVASLIYCMSNLPHDMYHVPIPPRNQPGRRDLDEAEEGGAGAGVRPRPPAGGGSRRSPGDAPAVLGQGPAIHPAEGQGGPSGAAAGPSHHRMPSSFDALKALQSSDRRVISGTSDSSVSTGSISTDSDFTGSSQTRSTPHSSPTTAIFPTQLDRVPPVDNLCRSRLKVHFDLPYDIGGQTLSSDPAGPKIVNRGVYLCHPILACLKGLKGPLFSPPSSTEIEALLSVPADDDDPPEIDTLTIVVRAYLGIGSTWTVFSALTATGVDIAVKYSAPDLYPTLTRPGQWDSRSVREAIAREASVLTRLGQLDAGSSSRCAPRWYGCWTGHHRALGQVWCSIMEAGRPVGNLTEGERTQVVETYQRLHSFGIIHGDVSWSNLCRINRDPSHGLASIPSASQSSDSTSIAIIDFGLAFMTRRAPRIIANTPVGESQGAGDSTIVDEAETETFSRKASNEMARVRAMLGV